MTSWINRALVCALTLALVIAPAASAEAAQRKKKPVDVTVMTRNIYLGGNIFGPLAAGNDRAEFERLAGLLWAEVQGTDFPGTRARLLVNEIKRTKPDLIGLQEVATWRRGPDGVKDGSTTPATQVVFDFLKTFKAELKRQGLNYKVGRVQQEADIETAIDAGYDVRLTMHDVILVKKSKNLKITGSKSANYKSSIGVPTPVGQITSKRGWTYVDATFKGKKLRFVNTHLEAASDDIRDAQARELSADRGPLRTGRDLIVVGDFNSDPQGRESTKDAVDILKDRGLVDAWPRKFGPGFSCCLNQSDARDTNADGFDHRIDLIFTKPKLKAISGRVVGNKTSDRAPNGLWPSDHAGVVLKLRLK